MNEDITTMQGFLDKLYQDMLPLSSQLTGVARALAGLFALIVITYKVWGHFARAEAIDVFPLLRPFGIGVALAFYPVLLSVINGLVQPVVTVTQGMAQNGQQAVQTILAQQQQLPAVTGDSAVDLADEIGAKLDSIQLNPTTIIQEGLTTLLQWLFEGASMILSVLQTFIRVVMSIMGPLALGLSVLDGFRNSYQQWLARYIGVCLWLPVVNIYGAILAKVQVLMIQQDASGDFVHGHGLLYIIFLLMGIIGYTCVPSTAGYVVQSLGGHALLSKVNTTAATLA
jgi:hypothetical protein